MAWLVGTGSQTAEDRLRYLITAEHEKVVGKGLSFDPQLVSVAKYKVLDMAVRNYRNHQSPEGQYSDAFFGPLGFASTASGEIYGENTVIVPADGDERLIAAEGIFKAFMESPPHAAVIRSANQTKIGVASVKLPPKPSFDNAPLPRHLFVVEFRRP